MTGMPQNGWGIEIGGHELNLAEELQIFWWFTGGAAKCFELFYLKMHVNTTA